MTSASAITKLTTVIEDEQIRCAPVTSLLTTPPGRLLPTEGQAPGQHFHPSSILSLELHAWLAVVGEDNAAGFADLSVCPLMTHSGHITGAKLDGLARCGTTFAPDAMTHPIHCQTDLPLGHQCA